MHLSRRKHLNLDKKVHSLLVSFFGILLLFLILPAFKHLEPKVHYTIDTSNFNKLSEDVDIIRRSLRDSLIIHFPNAGTSNHLFIYNLQEYQAFKMGQFEESPTDFSNRIEGVRVDFTEIADGQYLVCLVSCQVGSKVVIDLKSFSINL